MLHDCLLLLLQLLQLIQFSHPHAFCPNTRYSCENAGMRIRFSDPDTDSGLQGLTCGRYSKYHFISFLDNLQVLFFVILIFFFIVEQYFKYLLSLGVQSPGSEILPKTDPHPCENVVYFGSWQFFNGRQALFGNLFEF